MSSNVRGRPRAPSKEEVKARKTKAIKICQLFSRLDLKSVEKELEEDSRRTQPHTPLPEATPSLSKKYWDSYGTDCQTHLAEILRNARGQQKSWHFDARSRFYDQLIPLFGRLRLRNATIFRMVQLVESALTHQTFHTWAHGLKRCDPNSPERANHYFDWWLFTVALPCLVIACEQTEAGIDWKAQVIAACVALGIAVDLGRLHTLIFELYRLLEDHLYDLTYADMTVSIFSKLPMNAHDASVVRELTERLLLQQLMYDAELSSQPTSEEMVQAAALLMLERLQEYLEELLREQKSIPDFVESLRQIRQSLLQFPRKVTCEVNSRLAHIRNNVEQINESAEDGSGQLGHLRRLISD